MASQGQPVLATAEGHAPRHKLTIDDVLDLTRVDQIAPSPDGEWVAVVVQRAARPGEVYGRTFYELDPSRADIWLISRRTGERRNLTLGAKAAAGFWCATWSPDGSKLAMLSTRPEGNEPRGGDNVRLYLWNRTTSALTRLGDAAMMTQTRGGSPLYRMDLRGHASGGTRAHHCSDTDENAPFAWLDNDRLLTVTHPRSGLSGLLDEYSRPMRHAGNALQALRDGTVPTVTVMGSGAERLKQARPENNAILGTIDTRTGAAVMIAALPSYPFRGELTLSIAPDRRRIAVLTTLGAIPPTRGQRIPGQDDTWSVEKRLGFVEVTPNAAIRWSPLPPHARYPLELFGWSPDGRKVALRARDRPDAEAASLLVISPNGQPVAQISAMAMPVGNSAAGSNNPHESSALWIDDRRLLVRLHKKDSRADWWLLTPNADAVNLTANTAEPPAGFRRSTDGNFFALIGNRLMRLDADHAKLVPVSSPGLSEKSAIVWPSDAARETPGIVVADYPPAEGQRLQWIPLVDTQVASRHITLPHGAQLLDVDPVRKVAWWRQPTSNGLFFRETSLSTGRDRNLLSLNTHLARVDWGRTLLIDYRGTDDQPLKAAVILPPDYRPGRRYPTITWVYAGYRVNTLDDYFLDPYLPGFYNLQLYASRGHVVLIPSIPLTRGKGDIRPEIPKGVLPAVDRLIELGIADPARLGVMGQSFGGYSVYALLTQTNRFKAAIAMAGIADLPALYTQFDATARGYPGIDHEKSYNWSIVEQFGMAGPPHDDHARYWRNSPLAFVDRVETPLLLIHGEYDTRGAMSQADAFFYSLYQQGKTARLLRYSGENHGLSLSPANVRSVFEETTQWLDKYLIQPPR